MRLFYSENEIMKKIILSSVIGLAAIALTGCNEWELLRGEVKGNLTSSENSLMLALSKSNTNTNDDSIALAYYGVFHGYKSFPDNSDYFCSKQREILFAEYSISKNANLKDFITLSKIVEDTTGKTLYEVCSDENNGSSDKEPLVKKDEKPTFKVDKTETTYQLSSQMYDDLIIAVHECKRAEFQTMQSFKQNDKLTKEQYDNVVNIIMSCKQYQLERALQGDDSRR